MIASSIGKSDKRQPNKKELTPYDARGGTTTTRQKETSERAQDRNTHFSKCALADDLDRPEIPQADLRPTEPQKLRLRAHMPPDFTQPTVLRHACERSLKLGASTQRNATQKPTSVHSSSTIASHRGETERNVAGNIRAEQSRKEKKISTIRQVRSRSDRWLWGSRANVPDVQVDRGLERNAVMRL